MPLLFVCRSASHRKTDKLSGERAALTHRLEQSYATDTLRLLTLPAMGMEIK